MSFYQNHKPITYVLLAVLLIVLVTISELIFIKFNGENVPVPEISRGREVFGTGAPLTYVVLGDSTAVGQGGDYSKGIAISTAKSIATSKEVTFQNFGASGAVIADVLNKQVGEAVKISPDIVLISAGANDVTHLSSVKLVKEDMLKIIAKLRSANPSVKVIITGAPQMGSVPRFPQPIRYIAGLRTDSMNQMFMDVSASEKITFAKIAELTGPAFDKNPGLFAKDKFHPNDSGYELWVSVIRRAIKDALAV